MANTSGPTLNVASMPGVPALRVVAAVSPDERRLFLGRVEECLAGLPIDLVWLDTRDRGVPASRLVELNPQIMLTGWSTGPLPVTWLQSQPCALRYVCHLAGSVRWLLPRSFIEGGGVVTNWGDVPSQAVAEQALLLALAALRNLPAWADAADRMQDTVRRVEGLRTLSLSGRRVGIHGFGRVVRALIPLLRPFGVSISVFSVGVPAELIASSGASTATSLPELFRGSEVLFECEGLTPSTAGSVSAAMLALLPDGALFVNIARGHLVDESALLREVVAGRLRVGLDVLATQPWAVTAQAFRAAGAVVSPHIGGPTLDQYARCGEHALGNVARFVRGEPLCAQVGPADYDRST